MSFSRPETPEILILGLRRNLDASSWFSGQPTETSGFRQTWIIELGTSNFWEHGYANYSTREIRLYFLREIRIRISRACRLISKDFFEINIYTY